MKMLLTLPRFEHNANPPLGIAYIASYLKQRNFDVEILDPTFENFEFAEKRLLKADYDILGLSCFTMNYNLSKKLAAIAKQANPNVLTAFGGVHPTIMPELCIKDREVDAVIIGEGEQTFAEIAENLEKNKSLKGIKGLWFKSGKRVFKNSQRPLIKDLDSLPFPARELLPMDKYIHATYGTSAWAVKQPSTTVISGRGCPYQCTYCATKQLFGLTIRLRSAKNLVDEIELLMHNYRIKGLQFVDDTFTINQKLVSEVCDEIAARRLDIEWACHTRVNNVSLELFRKMRQAGCKVIGMGIESGNQWVLDNLIKKGITLEQARTAFKWAKSAGLITDSYFMIGIPGETKGQIMQTIEFAKELNPDAANFNITRPLPKTEMYCIAEKYGKITAKDWDDYSFDARSIYATDAWTEEEIQALLKRAYREFYFRPGFVLKQLFGIRSSADLRKIANGLRMVLNRLSVKSE